MSRSVLFTCLQVLQNCVTVFRFWRSVSLNLMIFNPQNSKKNYFQNVNCFGFYPKSKFWSSTKFIEKRSNILAPNKYIIKIYSMVDFNEIVLQMLLIFFNLVWLSIKSNLHSVWKKNKSCILTKKRVKKVTLKLCHSTSIYIT